MMVKDSYFFAIEAENSTHCSDILIWLKHVFECIINLNKRQTLVIAPLKIYFLKYIWSSNQTTHPIPLKTGQLYLQKVTQTIGNQLQKTINDRVEQYNENVYVIWQYYVKKNHTPSKIIILMKSNFRIKVFWYISIWFSNQI